MVGGLEKMLAEGMWAFCWGLDVVGGGGGECCDGGTCVILLCIDQAPFAREPHNQLLLKPTLPQ